MAKGRLASDKNRHYFLDNLFIWEEFPESLHDFYNTLGSLYYFGNEEPFFEENKEKAFQWYCLAAAESSFYGAINAGDMAEKGDGIPVSEEAATALYERALEIEKRTDVYMRLASYYQNGTGTAVDRQKAMEYLIISMTDGDTQGYYQYLSDNRLDLSENLVLSKAVSSLDYKWTSIDMIYGVWYTYSASSSKLKVIELLSRAWEDGTDTVVLEIKENIKNSEYFPSDFIEECVMASYTYSYRAFAKTYGIIPNRGREDAKKLNLQK